MKLIDALTLVQAAAASDAPVFRVFLACGFTPLHLQTFLAGHVQQRVPDRRVVVDTGLFGDLTGSLARLGRAGDHDAAAVVIEWADLDPRLGIRSLGGWRPADLPAIAGAARERLAAVGSALRALSAHGGRLPVAVSLPTLPLPPIATTACWQASAFELDSRAAVATFAAEVAGLPLVRLVSAQEIDKRSPPAKRFEPRAELATGHPFATAHDEVLASVLGQLLCPAPVKKGLITDLDGTLWRGLVGEVGAAEVAWTLDGHGQLHGLYQQVLRSLSDQGVLLAVASKNDPAPVGEALRRADLLVDPAAIFPVEAHWGPKSESVGRILRAWNVGADSVVFVDDSPMELAEVGAAFPGIECLRFPDDDPSAVGELLERLRASFGRESAGAEDALRMATIKSAAARDQATRESASPDAFLEQIDAAMELCFRKLPVDPRAFELVNKTNQWNLNGRRETDAAWRTRLDDPDTFLFVASYGDKYGPLGKIAVLRGRLREEGSPAGRRVLHVDAWVMSCRAFARRIEHRCIERLFARFDVDEIVFDYASTERNGPLTEFFASVLGETPLPALRLTRETFAGSCPKLHHSLSEP